MQTFEQLIRQDTEDQVDRVRRVRITCTDGFAFETEILGSKQSIRRYYTSTECESEIGYRTTRFIDFLG